MASKAMAIIVAAALLVAAAVLIIGTGHKQAAATSTISTSVQSIASTTVTTSIPAPQALKGVTLTPRSFNSTDFKAFFSTASQAGGVISGGGSILTLNQSDSEPTVLMGLSGPYNYVPVIEVQVLNQTNGELYRQLNASTVAMYDSTVLAFVSKYKPKYIAIGVEVNLLYERSPQDFHNFTIFYNGLYGKIKNASPSTIVFTIFQLERMKGLNGGLFGGKNDTSNSEWQLLDGLSGDAVGFTTYPEFIYQNPNQIPSDYYSGIMAHTSKPIFLTEIGWSSADVAAGWSSTPAEQAAFISRLSNMTSGGSISMRIWSFAYDQNVGEPFTNMGLLYSNGTAKPAWQSWVSMR
ncbi:MAG: hypothetical protein KGH69_04915 [Candidatus Micrarchaeota archaeon]|nr:hypothetical protein [Candidatus Micrarchaeota archaeon]